MKIIGLMAQNIKNLKAIEIRPQGNITQITGANGAGKSAILDAILTTLTGKRLEDPIRHGETNAKTIVETDEFIAEKRWTQKGEYLTVMSKSGHETKKSPQAFLDKVIGKLTFDPLAFQRMKPTEQLDLLKKLVGLDFSDIEAEQKKVYEERTGVNSSIRGVIAQLQNIPAPDPNTPDTEISYKDELQKLNQLREKRNQYTNAINIKEGLALQIKSNDREVEVRKQKIEQLVKEMEAINQRSDELAKQREAIILPPEVTVNQVTEAEDHITEIEEKNVAIRAAARYRELTRNGEKLKQEADGLTVKLERLEQDKTTRIATVKMPIDGLSLSDADIIYEGIPFARLSTGQQIRISTAIAMKLNPDLRVIFIREGSFLDSASKAEIEKLAQEHDYDVWMEIVDETGEVGFFIESGENTKIDGEDCRPTEGIVA